ncbi:MarR family winged helix-turn-helix transcriptional regulator [Lysobacter soyae]|uniref:MarR family transcriptional regulator n=1 Tax=Lysobacter soyae TaxID=2764185 RepID=A0ABX8WNY0_9GAMM|nr:MarR family transcriptional regulator [Lysobacter sp. CJ11]QYR52436.1 MarR family transcriptional regulator [Lysobacter sp. CJ11]
MECQDNLRTSSIGVLFKQTRDAMWAAMSRALSAEGLDFTFSQYITLKRLSQGASSAGELARAVEIHPGAMTRLLDQLETRGLVRRLADPEDRRALKVELTEEGQNARALTERIGEQIRMQAMEGLNLSEREELVRLLSHVRNNLNKDIQ